MGVSTPIIISERIQFSWEIMRNYLTPEGLRPAAGRPDCDSAVLPVKKKGTGSFRTGNTEISHARLSPQRGQGWRKGGQPKHLKRFSTEQKK
jgi:hypothetical protein